jgi:hypothetical protein
MTFPAVQTFHLLRFREVLEVCTADEAAGGWGHVVGFRWVYIITIFVRDSKMQSLAFSRRG